LAQEEREAATKAAAAHFESAGQLDSELHSVCFAALAAKMLNNSTDYSIYSAKAVDISFQIRHTWDPNDYKTYMLRPDLELLRREIPEPSH
jgi:hypothetical protein